MATINDGELKVWKTEDFELIKEISLSNKATRIEYQPDDNVLITYNQSLPCKVIALQPSNFSIVKDDWVIQADNWISAFSRDSNLWAVSCCT